MSELINAPMTRKEFLTLPMELRRKILERQTEQLSNPSFLKCLTCGESEAVLHCKVTKRNICIQPLRKQIPFVCPLKQG